MGERFLDSSFYTIDQDLYFRILRVFTTFANPGDWILAEEWTYPSALASARPWGIKAVPIAFDGEGLSTIDLRRVLVEWDEVERGGKRFVLSTHSVLPHGSHEISGLMSSTLFLSARILQAEWVILELRSHPYSRVLQQTVNIQRKQEIYDICVEFGPPPKLALE